MIVEPLRSSNRYKRIHKQLKIPLSTKAKIKTFQKSETTADLPENYVCGIGPHIE